MWRLVSAVAAAALATACGAPAAAQTTAVGPGVPNGSFECHKISSSGMLISAGTLQVRGGRGQVVGMPDGWTVTSITLGVRDSRGQQIIRVAYRSTSGNSDVLDCVRG